MGRLESDPLKLAVIQSDGSASLIVDERLYYRLYQLLQAVSPSRRRQVFLGRLYAASGARRSRAEKLLYAIEINSLWRLRTETIFTGLVVEDLRN